MTYRQTLWSRALDNHGYVTTIDAYELGIPPIELRKLAYRGRLVNVSRGVYRFPEAPSSDIDQFAEAVLSVGRDAYLSHDAVLALHELALVNPRAIRVAVPHRFRGKPPASVHVTQRAVAAEDLTEYDGVPSTTVARALLDCVGLVMTERLLQGADEARQRGLMTRREHATVTETLAAAS